MADCNKLEMGAFVISRRLCNPGREAMKKLVAPVYPDYEVVYSAGRVVFTFLNGVEVFLYM